jgi:hypothetical protein
MSDEITIHHFEGKALDDLKARLDDMVKQETGMSPAEAKAQGLCFECKEPALAKCHSDAGRREYAISGMCEKCFDATFAEDEHE